MHSFCHYKNPCLGKFVPPPECAAGSALYCEYYKECTKLYNQLIFISETNNMADLASLLTSEVKYIRTKARRKYDDLVKKIKRLRNSVNEDDLQLICDIYDKEKVALEWLQYKEYKTGRGYTEKGKKWLRKKILKSSIKFSNYYATEWAMGFLKLEDLPVYLSSNDNWIRRAAKKRFDQLVNYSCLKKRDLKKINVATKKKVHKGLDFYTKKAYNINEEK